MQERGTPLIYIKAQGAGMTNEASTPHVEGYQAHLGLFNLIWLIWIHLDLLDSFKLFWSHLGSFELI